MTLSSQIREAQGLPKGSPYFDHAKAAQKELSNSNYQVVYRALVQMENGEDEEEVIEATLKSISTDPAALKSIKSFFDRHLEG